MHGNRIRREVNDSMAADKTTTSKPERGTESPTQMNKTADDADIIRSAIRDGDGWSEVKSKETKDDDITLGKGKVSENGTEASGGGDSRSEAAADVKPNADEGASKNVASKETLAQAGDKAAEVDAKSSNGTAPETVENAGKNATEKQPLDKEATATTVKPKEATEKLPVGEEAITVKPNGVEKANEGKGADDPQKEPAGAGEDVSDDKVDDSQTADDTQKESAEKTTTVGYAGDGEFVCGVDVVRLFIILGGVGLDKTRCVYFMHADSACACSCRLGDAVAV